MSKFLAWGLAIVVCLGAAGYGAYLALRPQAKTISAAEPGVSVSADLSALPPMPQTPASGAGTPATMPPPSPTAQPAPAAAPPAAPPAGVATNPPPPVAKRPASQQSPLAGISSESSRVPAVPAGQGAQPPNQGGADKTWPASAPPGTGDTAAGAAAGARR